MMMMKKFFTEERLKIGLEVDGKAMDGKSIMDQELERLFFFFFVLKLGRWAIL